MGRYFADIRNEDGIIEIQTRALYRLKPKAGAFLPLDAVTVVYPIAAVKRLSWLDPKTGEKSAPRRSPKKGTRYDCVRELYALRDYLLRDGFRLCLVFLELEEVRLKNGWGNGGQARLRADGPPPARASATSNSTTSRLITACSFPTRSRPNSPQRNLRPQRMSRR